jgi:hypothetical protein
MPLWFALLCAASVALKLGFTCVAPLAALGAVAALTINRRAALLAAGSVWLANQIAGFAILNYPMHSGALMWAAALGVATLSACEAAGFAARHVSGLHVSGLAAFGAAFLAAFAVYQGCVVGTSLAAQTSLEYFTVEFVARNFAINVATFAILLAANHLAIPVKRASRPPVELASRLA